MRTFGSDIAHGSTHRSCKSLGWASRESGICHLHSVLGDQYESPETLSIMAKWLWQPRSRIRARFLGRYDVLFPARDFPRIDKSELGCIGEVREQGAAHEFGGLCTDDVK